MGFTPRSDKPALFQETLLPEILTYEVRKARTTCPRQPPCLRRQDLSCPHQRGSAGRDLAPPLPPSKGICRDPPAPRKRRRKTSCHGSAQPRHGSREGIIKPLII